MTLFRQLELDNVVVFKKAVLNLDNQGLVLVTGHNRDSQRHTLSEQANVTAHQSNGSGKSLLFSSLATLLYDAPPLSARKSARKDLLTNKSEIRLSLTCSEGDDYVFSQKASKISVLKNGEDMQVRTLERSKQILRSIVPISDVDFYSYCYLSTQRPLSFLYETDLRRSEIISDLFRFGIYDDLKGYFSTRLRGVRDASVKLGTLMSEQEKVNTQLLTDCPWSNDSDKQVEALVESRTTATDRLVKISNAAEALTGVRDSFGTLKSITYEQAKLRSTYRTLLSGIKLQGLSLPAITELLSTELLLRQQLDNYASEAALYERKVERLLGQVDVNWIDFNLQLARLLAFWPDLGSYLDSHACLSGLNSLVSELKPLYATNWVHSPECMADLLAKLDNLRSTLSDRYLDVIQQKTTLSELESSLDVRLSRLVTSRTKFRKLFTSMLASSALKLFPVVEWELNGLTTESIKTSDVLTLLALAYTVIDAFNESNNYGDMNALVSHSSFVRVVIDSLQPTLKAMAIHSECDHAVCPACGQNVDYDQIVATLAAFEDEYRSAQSVIDMSNRVDQLRLVLDTVKAYEESMSDTDLEEAVATTQHYIQEATVLAKGIKNVLALCDSLKQLLQRVLASSPPSRPAITLNPELNSLCTPYLPRAIKVCKDASTIASRKAEIAATCWRQILKFRSKAREVDDHEWQVIPAVVALSDLTAEQVAQLKGNDCDNLITLVVEFASHITQITALQRKSMTEIESNLATLLRIKNTRFLLTQRLKDLEAQVDTLQQQAQHQAVLESLVAAYSGKGLRNIALTQVTQLIETNMNQFAPLLFGENFVFKLTATTAGLSATVDRGQNRVSDVRLLSGSESNCYSLLFLLSVLALIPSHRRSNVIVLDEMDSHQDDVTRQRFFNDYLPVLKSVIPSVFVITPRPPESLSMFDLSLRVEKKKGVSKLVLTTLAA
jgi:hypothetical protein